MVLTEAAVMSEVNQFYQNTHEDMAEEDQQHAKTADGDA